MAKSSKKQKFNLHKLFSDNRFLLVISVIIAVVFWAAVCISFSPETEVVVEDVPVKIEMENSVPDQYGLRMFGDTAYTVDITVSGSRYVVGGKLLSASDFNVTASTALVTSAGTHALQLKVSKANESADFTIKSISESFINVYFDEYAETQANIIVNVDAVDIVPDGYIAGDDYIMDKKTVQVAGPALEISQLDSVVADLKLDEELTQSKAFNVALKAIKKDGSSLKYVTIDGESNVNAAVTIPVYKLVNIPVAVKFTDSPANYVTNQLNYTCSPSNVSVGILQNGTDYKTLDVGTISFSKIKPGENSFEFNLSQVEGVKTTENSVSSVYVRFTSPDAKSSNFSISTDNISVSNAPEGYTVKFTSSRISNVTVYGSDSELSALAANGINARIDLSGISIKEGRNTVELPILLKDCDSCWAYGTYKISFVATADSKTK